MTGRADAILAAVRDQIEARRGALDATDDLAEVTITVKLQAGTTWVRGVVWQEERRTDPRTRVERRAVARP